jgi:hypothetical protein
MQKEQYIILAGGPFDGFTFYGVFDDFDEARLWADETLGFNVEWWTAKVEPTHKEEQ